MKLKVTTIIWMIWFVLFTGAVDGKETKVIAIQNILDQVYLENKDLQSGANADYIPELAHVPSELFGIALATVDGKLYSTGDAQYKFSIQSVSKVFTLATVMDEIGSEAVLQKIGANATGRPFNSIIAMEDLKDHPSNPFVNAGAIATTSLVDGNTAEQKWLKIFSNFQRFANSSLAVNEPVYSSESANNQRNQAIAKLLESYNRIYFDPAETVDLYTRQCAINVSAENLAVMAATLANNGTNPISNDKIVSPAVVPRVLAIMATAGLYDESGNWLYNVGLPAKSGVGGGIIVVVPGKFGIAAFSPRLNEAGNSIKAINAITAIAKELNANIFFKQYPEYRRVEP